MQLFAYLTNFYNVLFFSLFILIVLNSFVEGTNRNILKNFFKFNGKTLARRNSQTIHPNLDPNVESNVEPYVEPEFVPHRRAISSRDEIDENTIAENENFDSYFLGNLHQQTNIEPTSEKDAVSDFPSKTEQKHDIVVKTSDGFKRQADLLFKLEIKQNVQENEEDYYISDSDAEESNVQNSSSTSSTLSSPKHSKNFRQEMLSEHGRSRHRSIVNTSDKISENMHNLATGLNSNRGANTPKKIPGHITTRNPRPQNHQRTGNNLDEKSSLQKRSNIHTTKIVRKDQKSQPKLIKYKSC